MAGRFGQRRKTTKAGQPRPSPTPVAWTPRGGGGVGQRHSVTGATTPTVPANKPATSGPKTPHRKQSSINTTFSNSLMRAISGRRTLASSHSRLLRVMDGHAGFLCLGLETLWKESVLCDVCVAIEQQRIFAHRIVLCTFSDVFYDIIIGDNRAPSTAPRNQPKPAPSKFLEITLQDLNPSAVRNIIECMYTGKINIIDDNVREVLDAATYLKIKPIVKECEKYLCDNLDKDNCARMLHIATGYQLPYLEEVSMKMIAKNFEEVSVSYDFLRLHSDHMVEILSRDDLLVSSELEVLRGALGWMEMNSPLKADSMERVFKTIRLPLLSPQEIVDNVESVDYLMQNSRCQFLVKEALHYHCLPARQSILQSERTVPRACSRYTAILAIGGAPRLVQEPVNREIHYLDPLVGKWTLLTRMPEPRHHHGVAILGGFLYVAGGEKTNDQQSPTNTAFRFDPRTDSWLKIADMNTCRESFQLVVLMDMLYAIGGRLNQDESLSSVERYNPALDEWQEIAELSSPRRSMAATSHNGRIYVMGGSGEKRISSIVERYNPLLNRWEQRRRLSCPRFFAQLATTKTRLFLVGGATVDARGSVVGMPYIEAYNPLNDTWCRLRQILEPRAEFGLTVLGNRLYIIGGYSWDRNERLKSVEIYDLVQNNGELLADIGKPYTGISACTLVLYHRLDGKPMYHKTDPQLHGTREQEQGNKETIEFRPSRVEDTASVLTSGHNEIHHAYSDLR